MAYYPKSGSGGGYGRTQFLPGGPNDYHGALRTIEDYDSQQTQIDKSKAASAAQEQGSMQKAIQIALAKQMAEENNLEASAIKYDKNGAPMVDYKAPSEKKPAAEKPSPSTTSGIDDLLNKSNVSGDLPLGMEPKMGGFSPSQIQSALDSIGSGSAPAAPPTTAPTPGVNTNLPAMQAMLQQQAMGGNPIVQRIAALNKDAQEQPPQPDNTPVVAFDKDGNPGTIPRSQIQAAIKKGYKVSGF